MAEPKATQCPICMRGKREQDRFCSEKCAATSEANARSMREAVDAEIIQDLNAAQSALPTLTFGVCPTCGGQAQGTCRCMRSDSRCSNGHWWHHDGEFIHAGESDHGSKVCCRGEPIAKWRKSA